MPKRRTTTWSKYFCNSLTGIITFLSTNLQFIAITWIKEFVQLSGPAMLPYMSGIFTAVLPCLAYDTDARRSILHIIFLFHTQKKSNFFFHFFHLIEADVKRCSKLVLMEMLFLQCQCSLTLIFIKNFLLCMYIFYFFVL
jgi:hypothetical protein